MAFVAQRVGMGFIGPFLFNGIRMCLGALTLLLVVLISNVFAGRRRNPDTDTPPQEGDLQGKRLLLAGIACGVILFLAGNFQQAGLVYTTASKAGFLTALYIVLVPILGITLKHKTYWNTWVSVLVAALGLYFLCMTGSASIQFGDLIMLIGAFFWACHILVIDHFVGGLSQRGVMKLCVAQFSVAALLSLISSPFFDPLFITEPFTLDGLIAALPAVLYTGVLSTGIAFTLQAVGQQGLNPSAASIIMSLEAVFSVVGGMLILGEALSLYEWLGCGLMFIAVIVSQLQSQQAKSTS
jgi:drug/metabolite transporter (DMT)-like permease